jgi:hypothetical protein
MQPRFAVYAHQPCIGLGETPDEARLCGISSIFCIVLRSTAANAWQLRQAGSELQFLEFFIFFAPRQWSAGWNDVGNLTEGLAVGRELTRRGTRRAN